MTCIVLASNRKTGLTAIHENPGDSSVNRIDPDSDSDPDADRSREPDTDDKAQR
jgi:hypothetical protein